LRDSLVVDAMWRRELAKFFSPRVIKDLVASGQSPFIQEILLSTGLNKTLKSKATVKDLFQWVYAYLSSNYRNEYIYKNAIAKQVLLGAHSIEVATLLTELRVGECKADVVVLNGTSTVYEIKSELDTMERLDKQLYSYREVFDHINVITSECQYEKVKSRVADDVGISLLDKDGTIRVVQESNSCKHTVSPSAIFDLLRKPEYTKIIQDVYGTVPDVPNTQFYASCKKLFVDLPPEKAHDLMKEALQQREDRVLLKKFLDKTPDCLYAYFLSSGIKKKDSVRLIEILNMDCKSVF